MTTQPNLWIAIADGEHARLVARAADNALHTQSSLDSTTAHQQTSDLVSDRAGRAHEKHLDQTKRHVPAHRPA